MTNSRQYRRWIKITKQIASKRTHGPPIKLNIKETAKGREGYATDLRKKPHLFFTSVSGLFFLTEQASVYNDDVWHFLLSISLRNRRLEVVGARKERARETSRVSLLRAPVLYLRPQLPSACSWRGLLSIICISVDLSPPQRLPPVIPIKISLPADVP